MPLSQLDLDDYDLASFVQAAAGFGQSDYAYVVTPNADHLIRLDAEEGFRAAYRRARFVLLDSRFIARLVRWAGGGLLPVCPGSDLTARLFDEVIGPDDRVVLVGARPEQAQALMQRYGLRGLVHHDPPMGFADRPAEVEACLEFVEAHSPFRFCMLAVGAPRQELLASLLLERGRARGLALCIGASIDFLTGAESRAPQWMQSAGLEWLYRLLQSPRRLGHRYLVRGPRVFALLRRIRIRLRPRATA